MTLRDDLARTLAEWHAGPNGAEEWEVDMHLGAADAILASDLIRKIRAEVWDDGYVRGWGEGNRTELSEHEYRHPTNPHREEQA